MSHSVQLPSQAELELLYPPSDAPMVEGSEQFSWLKLIADGLEAIFADRDDVVVAGDMMWYPVERDSQTCVAPDVFVVFGRPRQRRSSYVQFAEEGVPPHVVFEILSPGNRPSDVEHKLWFYDHYGVEEYYTFVPESHRLRIWTRVDGVLQEQFPVGDWRSPLLGVRFDWVEEESLRIFGPDGREIEHYAQVTRERDEAVRARIVAEQARLAEQRARRESDRKLVELEQATAAAQRDTAEELARLRAENEALRRQARNDGGDAGIDA